MRAICISIAGQVLLCVLFAGTIFAEGGQITFSAGLANQPSNIYMVDEDGENFTNLTRQHDDSSYPTWRPDGEYLAFIHELFLCTMRANGNDFEKSAVGGGNPTWSPDGQWIAIEQEIADDLTHIFIVNPDGSNPMDVTPGSDSHSMPVWNPASGELLCLSHTDGERFIGEIDVSNKEVYYYAHDTNLFSFGISFSPDGLQWVTVTPDEGLVIVDADRLDYDVVESMEGMYVFDPSWSLDGKKIAYAILDTERNTRDIYTFDLISHEQKQVTNQEFTKIHSIIWRPDPTVTAVAEKKPLLLTLTATPNPFNPSTTVTYTLTEAGEIELGVFSVLGQKIADIVTGYRSVGTHRAQWNASGRASGVYVIRLKAGDMVTTRMVTLMK